MRDGFQDRYGHFEHQVMPLGLSNAPASHQGYVNKILAEGLGFFVIVHLDDILNYTEDPDQDHVEAVAWVFKNLRKHGLFANLKKRPPGPGHESSMDMTCKNNVIDNFSPTLKSIRPSGPGHESSMDMICGISFFSYFEEYPAPGAGSSKLYGYDI